MRAVAVAPVPYDLVDHTADLGVIVRGGSLAEVYARAAAALADLLYEPEAVEEKEARERKLHGSEPETLLVRWLNELIVLRETEDFLWRRVQVEIGEPLVLRARLVGERFDPSRHQPRTALKAATYHELSVRSASEGLEAKIIFDV